LSVAHGVLLISSAEGLFRYFDGRFEKLASTPNLSALAVSSGLLAAASPAQVTLYRFAGSPIIQTSAQTAAPAVPIVGSL